MKARGLMIIHNFRPGNVGGAEIQAERLARQLTKEGHSMQVLTRLTVSSAPLEEISENVSIHRTEFRLPYWVNQDGVDTFRYLVKNSYSYDIIHCHMAYAHSMVATIVARCFSKRCIIKIACADEFGELANFSKFEGFDYALAIIKQADAFVAISNQVKKELIEYGFPVEKIIQIPNGVDTDYFQPVKTDPRNKAFTFIQIGRLHPQKGVDVALKAVKLLCERNITKNFMLKFYGTDYGDYNYPSIANSLGIGDMVEFHPFSQNIRDVYQSADAFLLPSRGEGLSNSLLEAMAMELPVIATQVSGTEDVLTSQKDGLIIPMDSAEALAMAMQTILASPQLAAELGTNARTTVESHFSIRSVGKQYSDLYHCLCGTSR